MNETTAPRIESGINVIGGWSRLVSSSKALTGQEDYIVVRKALAASGRGKNRACAVAVGTFLLLLPFIRRVQSQLHPGRLTRSNRRLQSGNEKLPRCLNTTLKSNTVHASIKRVQIMQQLEYILFQDVELRTRCIFCNCRTVLPFASVGVSVSGPG